MLLRTIVLALLMGSCGWPFEDAPQSSAADIMKRVAENQDREQQVRTEFVYQETLHRAMRRKDGKLLREEYRTFSVTPGPKGTEKKLLIVKGKYWKKGRYVSFAGDHVPDSGLFNVTFDDDGDDKTKDGIDKDLFPLTTDEQKKYEFELSGTRIVKGRPAYQIQFRPPNQKDYGWTGEALIDEEELQPISIYSRLSRRLPFAVRTMLGTDVPGLGYTVEYTRLDKDLWFPRTYGTEFSVRALFLLNRTFTESGESSNFRRVQVESHIDFGSPATNH